MGQYGKLMLVKKRASKKAEVKGNILCDAECVKKSQMQ